MLTIGLMFSTLKTNTLQNNQLNMKHIQLFEQFIGEATSIKDHMTKAAEYKKQLMDLKKGAKGAKDPQAHAARVAAKEEQLRRVADVIRNLRAEGVSEDADELTEAKDLRQLQRALDKLQNDYEAVLDDDALEALTQLITAVNLKLK
jgi:antirestriction protein